MAAKRVEGYLDQHKIGPLFEELMAKLIKEMPDQPVPFLIRLLKKLIPDETIAHSRPPSGSKSRSPMSSSMSLSGKQFGRQSVDDSRDSRRSALAKSWAAPSNHDRPTSASKSREYDKPWLKNSRKGRDGQHSHANKENTKQGFTRTNESPGSWNHDTKIPFNDFDEWFEAQNKKSSKGQAVEGTINHREQYPSWKQDEEDMDLSSDKRGIGYPLQETLYPARTPSHVSNDDELEEEEIRPSRRKTRGETSEGNSVASHSSYSSGRSSKKNVRHAASEHRKQLESLLLNSSSCSSQHHAKLSDEDDATELLENSHELENEGVTKQLKSGYKLPKTTKPTGASTEESVKVSICARCARIISGLPSDQRSDIGSHLSNGTDDDFESVSQTGSMTGGPARITWPSGFDSENDTVTPRNTNKPMKPMWDRQETKSPKGKHMYNRNTSTFLTDLVGSPSPRPTSAASGRSDDVFVPKPGKGWRTKNIEYSSDNDTEYVNPKYGRSSPSSTRLASGRPWSRPLDSTSDAGSEDWELDQSKKVKFKSKGFRRGYLTDDSDR